MNLKKKPIIYYQDFGIWCECGISKPVIEAQGGSNIVKTLPEASIF